MRLNVHICYEAIEYVIPVIFMRAKAYFTLVRMIPVIRECSQGTITKHCTYNQTKFTVVITGNIQFSLGNIVASFLGKVLARPEGFIGDNQDFLTLLQFGERHPL